jgi:ankyrin repeat protein
VRLLLEHGARTADTNALAHALDEDRPEHLRLLLEHGADPNESATVAHAVRRGRGAETIELLAAHGADLDRPGGETWRGPVPLRTPYQHAVLRGKDELAEVLARLGASTDLDRDDAAVAAIARGERPVTPLPESLDPDAQEVLILTALRGGLERVVAAVGPRFSGVVGGSPPGTLLHHACWVGDVELVDRLLALGADPAAPSPAGFDRPLDWAIHASRYHGLSGRDYVGIAERLVAAGAPLEAKDPEAAEGPLADWVQRMSIASPNE